MKTFIVTGATSGLGLAIARELSRLPETRVVAAVRDLNKAKQLGLEALPLDVSSRADVARFVAAWKGPITGLVNNAGLQVSGPPQESVDGIELALATNYLGAYALTLGLLPLTQKVMFIGSGTQDPSASAARMFGFRGAKFAPLSELARTDGPLTHLDRYATSKGLASVATVGLAARFPRSCIITFDPGLMPGTGLARQRGAVERFVWSTVLPLVSRLLPDGSTTQHSAQVAAWLLTEATLESGLTYDHRRLPSRYLHPKVGDAVFAQHVVAETDAFLSAL